LDVLEAIRTRRAYRSLDAIPITIDLIKDLAESASLAPSCFNNQPWRFVFIKDQDMLREMLTTLSRTNKWIQRASMIVAVFSSKEDDCRVRGRDYDQFDTGMATAFLILRATELGLVAHPIAGYSEEKVKKVLGIPEGMQVITLVNIGKKSDVLHDLLSNSQKEMELTRPERLPFEKFAFIDKYG
jgi:nitroreductase